jgi:hypothetical protein
MLSEEDRKQATDEIIQEAHVLLKRLTARHSKRKWDRLIAALNAPISLALVSGLGIWFLTTQLQSRAASEEKRRDREQQLHENQVKLAAAFANSIPRSIFLVDRFKKREVWLMNNREEKAAFYYDKNSYPKTRDYYNTLVTQFMNSESPRSVCCQICALFKSEEIRKNAIELDALFDSMLAESSMEVLMKQFKMAERISDELSDQMTREILKY